MCEPKSLIQTGCFKIVSMYAMTWLLCFGGSSEFYSFFLSHRHSVLVFSPRGITLVSLLTSTVLFATIWAITNYVYARALLYTAPTDVTALFSSAPAFVFLFSICVLKEPPLVLRVGLGCR